MAPPKAEGWPLAIYSDPDVLTLDKHGQFIICGVCAEYYATCGGKKPKPVALNGCFRTRAWDVHKQRTRAHNKRQGGRNLSSRPDIAAMSTSDARTWLLPSFHEQRLSEFTPISTRLPVHEAASSPFAQAADNQPLHDRHRAFGKHSHPTPPMNTRRSARTGTSAPPSWRSQPVRPTHSTLVFPLVRRRSELRNWSDFDPAWSRPAFRHDWYPGNWPSAVGYDRRAVSRSASSSMISDTSSDGSKAATYAVSDHSQ